MKCIRSDVFGARFARGPPRVRAQIDHAAPFAAGGATEPGNAQLVHAACNRSKGARTAPSAPAAAAAAGLATTHAAAVADSAAPATTATAAATAATTAQTGNDPADSGAA
jgi:hypothetical protein